MVRNRRAANTNVLLTLAA